MRWEAIHRALVPAAVAIAAIGVAVLVGPAIGGGPLQGPFAYRNATGAFYAQAAVAATMVVVAVRRMPVRVLGIAVALGVRGRGGQGFVRGRREPAGDRGRDDLAFGGSERRGSRSASRPRSSCWSWRERSRSAPATTRATATP